VVGDLLLRLPEVFALASFASFASFDYRDLLLLLLLLILCKDGGWVVEGSFSSALPINPAS
jgi:hypothetical protein